MKFFLSSNPDRLSEVLSGFSGTATVEAEYGERVVEGTLVTLAHHGPRSGNLAPCLEPEHANDGRIEAVGLSHLDLDTVGGCAALLERKPVSGSFWKLAAFVDVNGPHKLAQSGAASEDINRLYAYWAWSEDRKTFAPRDGSVIEVTGPVLEAIAVLERIMQDDDDLITRGINFAQREDDLNQQSFVEMLDGVIVRVVDCFANHLYVAPDGSIARAVVTLRLDTHNLTVSLADPTPGVSCLAIVQELWGPEAGGHAGIAGGPRNVFFGLDDLVRLRDATRRAIAAE